MTKSELLSRNSSTSNCCKYPVGEAGFRQKLASRRHLLASGLAHAGRYYNLNRRPSSPNGGCQFQAVHGPRHIDVGDYEPNIVARLQNLNRLICIRGQRRRSLRL